MEEEAEKLEMSILQNYPQAAHYPPFTKQTDPAWWRNIPVDIRREIVKSKMSPEMLEKHGMKELSPQIQDLFVRYNVTISEENCPNGVQISVENHPPRWWQKAQDEIKGKFYLINYKSS